LIATLFHAALNTCEMLLPIPPGQPAFYIAVALRCLCAVILVIATGPNLERQTGRIGGKEKLQQSTPLA
jgi:hypothetical protein